jgi:dihydrofolate synthase/folylpolyglutamate synthase
MYKYLESLEKFGMNLGLDRITYLLDKLDDPHLKFRSIHIAGTNGKGSTAAMTASILKEAGYKVGLYTSPHLFDYRERIKVNGKDISLRDFSAGLRLVKKLSNHPTTQPPINPTVFEALTAVAFWYFAKKKIDYAVVEVGLGGRLDATNVTTPLVSIITNIDYEHTEVLGKSLTKIASEKAAIIKPWVPVVTAENKAEPLKVIINVCEEKGALLLGLGEDQAALKSGLPGKHQQVNAACAVSAVRMAGIKVPRGSIAKGLKKSNWPGRFQVVSKRPLIIVDGAHNPSGAKALRVTIKDMFPGKYSVVFGCQRTKDFKKIFKELRPVMADAIITRSSHPQAAAPEVISRYLATQRIAVRTAGSAKEALAKWSRKKPLLFTGSLFLAADALKLL